MLEFIRENLMLVLTIIGALISFLATFIGVVSKQKPVLVLAVLAVIGFVVGISYQLYAHNQKQVAAQQAAAQQQIEAAAQRTRDHVIDEINLSVKKTEITVDAIAGRLLQTGLAEVGTELVSIASSTQVEFELALAFSKGSSSMWRNFAQWLGSINTSGAAPSLTLVLGAGNHYDSGLLLAYLLTSPATRDALQPVVDSYSAWHSFASEPLFLQCYGSNAPQLQMVIIYAQGSRTPLAFAPARAFTQELMVYHRLGMHNQIDNVLNASSVAELRRLFPSLRTEVFTTTRPAELVKTMIEKQLPLAISADGQKTYVVRLERMIQLAASR